ncbi:MAG: hypothetical protein R3310_12520 [Candidatus Competibacteraceae bacterium]|nr:hypothetical protein [Candidatus Competibacteraceae bacterium]
MTSKPPMTMTPTDKGVFIRFAPEFAAMPQRRKVRILRELARKSRDETEVAKSITLELADRIEGDAVPEEAFRSGVEVILESGENGKDS